MLDKISQANNLKYKSHVISFKGETPDTADNKDIMCHEFPGIINSSGLSDLSHYPIKGKYFHDEFVKDEYTKKIIVDPFPFDEFKEKTFLEKLKQNPIIKKFFKTLESPPKPLVIHGYTEPIITEIKATSPPEQTEIKLPASYVKTKIKLGLPKGPFAPSVSKFELIQRLTARGLIGNKTSFKPRLTPGIIVDRMNEQLNIISPEQIQEIINSFKPEDRQLAAKILQRITQFGNMQSLNEIAKYVKSNNNYFHYFEYDVNHCMFDINNTMKYLSSNKSCFNRHEGMFDYPGKYYVLDKITLEELENNEEFLNEIKDDNEIKIIYPEGWINGINPFNQTDDIRTKIRKLLPIVKNYTNEGISEDGSIHLALNSEILVKIEDLGLINNFKIIRNNRVYNVKPTAKQISDQLKPPIITEKQLTEIINEYEPESQQLLMDYLANNADIYSPRRLSICLKKMHEKFQKKGMIDEDTYYYIPDNTKSYSIIAMMYKLANQIPNDRFIFYNRKIPKNARRIIILDDLAGSGNSLKNASNNIRENFTGNITIAPVISTYFAAERLSHKLTNATFCPYRIKNTIKESNYYKALNKDQQEKLIRKLGDLGYDFNGLSVVFPYMGPDNNNRFFAREIARNYTLNGKGVRNYA